jgi:hypothetical protein
MSDAMQMGLPAGNDPLGTAVVAIGSIVTLLAFALALRWTLWPGESSLDHPKRSILRDDR